MSAAIAVVPGEFSISKIVPGSCQPPAYSHALQRESVALKQPGSIHQGWALPLPSCGGIVGLVGCGDMGGLVGGETVSSLSSTTYSVSVLGRNVGMAVLDCDCRSCNGGGTGLGGSSHVAGRRVLMPR